MADFSVTVSSHEFDPIRFWDKLYEGGRCRACFAPKYAHPTELWERARPRGNKDRADG
jgi:hypothetical protein